MQVDLAECRLYSRALSRPTFAALARGAQAVSLFRFLKGTTAAKAKTVGELFERAFDLLHSSYRNEYVYKTAVANRIVFGRHSPRTASLSAELHIGRSIIDLAIFNGTSTAYEIKTSLDSPRRLATQTLDYLRAFDQVYVVTHPKQTERYLQSCDERVGILALNDSDSLSTVRTASINRENIDSTLLFRALRRSEYLPALESALECMIDAPNGLIAERCEKLFCALPFNVAHQIFVSALRSRGLASRDDRFVTDLPAHLRVLGYATPLTDSQKVRVLEALKTKLML